MGSYRLALGTRIVEALDSRSKTAALALGIGVLFGSTEFLVPVHGYFALHLAVMVAGAAAISYVLLVGARARRVIVLEHVRKIAELNHNVRNALEVILATQYLSRDVSEEDRKAVLQSVERIDATIRHLFPVVGERKEDRVSAVTVHDMRRRQRSTDASPAEQRRSS